MRGGGGVTLRFDPKTVLCGLQRARGGRRLHCHHRYARQIAAMAVMAASLPAASCEEIMSLASQQDSTR